MFLINPTFNSQKCQTIDLLVEKELKPISTPLIWDMDMDTGIKDVNRYTIQIWIGHTKIPY